MYTNIYTYRQIDDMYATFLLQSGMLTVIMCGFYYRFNNLRFKQSQHINDFSAAHVVILFVSSEIMKCRLLKYLSDHPMKLLVTACHKAVR